MYVIHCDRNTVSIISILPYICTNFKSMELTLFRYYNWLSRIALFFYFRYQSFLALESHRSSFSTFIRYQRIHFGYVSRRIALPCIFLCCTLNTSRLRPTSDGDRSRRISWLARCKYTVYTRHWRAEYHLSLINISRASSPHGALLYLSFNQYSAILRLYHPVFFNSALTVLYVSSFSSSIPSSNANFYRAYTWTYIGILCSYHITQHLLPRILRDGPAARISIPR